MKSATHPVGVAHDENVCEPGRVGGLYLQAKELEIVQKILSKWVPGREVWAFGSRATGTRLKRFSDLDLAIAGRLTEAESARLAEEFDESSLPFKVDVVELGQVEKEFRERIERDFVVMPPEERFQQ